MLPASTRTLVIGGARSGKSRAAERLMSTDSEVLYVATAYPAGGDQEWGQRIEAHRARRPAHWETVETLDLDLLLGQPGPSMLVDCLTLWLTRIFDRHDAWATASYGSVEREIDALVAAWARAEREVVAVTNELGQGIVPDQPEVRRFRDLMGELNTRIAAECGDVLWCVAGRVVRL
jgi:adenosylcobinamide kinase / adenosylcobinamide-phosphate guanylyltransferase